MASGVVGVFFFRYVRSGLMDVVGNYRVELLVKSKGEWEYESVMRGMLEGRDWIVDKEGNLVVDGEGNGYRSIGMLDVYSLQPGARFLSEEEYERRFGSFLTKFDCLSDVVLVGTFVREQEGEPQVYRGYREREMGGVFVSSLEVAKPPTPRSNHKRTRSSNNNGYLSARLAAVLDFGQ